MGFERILKKKDKQRKPFVPAARQETVRQKIISELTGKTLSARDISAAVSISEKEVTSHLEHIQKTQHKTTHPLIVTPAECKKCGFVFKKREKLKKPGKCPVCNNELISEPLFSLGV